MDNINWFEIIGYVASVLVAISLTMSSIVKLRVLNLIGAITFTIYGMLINAYPIAMVNGFIIIINIYFLFDMYGRKEYFSIMVVDKESKYKSHFIEFYQDDILNYNPGYDFSLEKDQCVFFILRDMLPAGLMILEKNDGGSHFVVLDYVIPKFRDFKIGYFLFHDNSRILKSKGIKSIYTSMGNNKHQKYLLKMGFTRSVYQGEEVFEKSLFN
ncbi:MAG: hypothetical protein HN729_08330 [Candidatus Marinimicrobia bacterium]|nr:hypothetical protein [Candidatus Neomarinimicrobiota bacterium]MBT3634973.1 hypothetical protein [Candidatus Neomarinimicrobiota bacterium]MBT3683678.1 hypothetical protein [Candidatus Neomarinimicrobiota bacterium]MBT3760818.1 hypothetical protein [Candidatus Neomarinimicrobiota bacterium]MBT3896888.1 hypothetical protein [Candidatus Neomarinimicrobiota bacterium]